MSAQTSGKYLLPSIGISWGGKLLDNNKTIVWGVHLILLLSISSDVFIDL